MIESNKYPLLELLSLRLTSSRVSGYSTTATDATIYKTKEIGHIHQNPAPSKLHLNVSVEATNYKPVHIEDVTARARAHYEAWVAEQ